MSRRHGAMQTRLFSQNASRSRCSSCSQEAHGVFHVDGQDNNAFYCFKCWEGYDRSYPRRARDDLDASESLCDNYDQYHLRQLLKALSQLGGSVLFSASFSDEMTLKLKEFCASDPSLASLVVHSHAVEGHAECENVWQVSTAEFHTDACSLIADGAHGDTVAYCPAGEAGTWARDAPRSNEWLQIHRRVGYTQAESPYFSNVQSHDVWSQSMSSAANTAGQVLEASSTRPFCSICQSGEMSADAWQQHICDTKHWSAVRSNCLAGSESIPTTRRRMWQQWSIPGGALRMNHADGRVELCSGTVPDEVQEEKWTHEKQRADELQRQLNHATGHDLHRLPLPNLFELQTNLTATQQKVMQEVQGRFTQPRLSGTWQWQVHDGTFRDFGAKAALEIAQHLSRHPDAPPLQVQNEGWNICIDFVTSEQYVVGRSGRRRPVRCANDLMLHEPSWTPQVSPTEVVLVKPGSSDFTKVLNHMFDVGHGFLGQKFIPIAVHRVQNMFLMRKFLAERSNLIEQRGAHELRETVLFHGTRKHSPLEITQGREGFMTEHSEEGHYGKGLYFAERPLYSHHYSHRSTDDTGKPVYEMLVCRVLCGKPRNMGARIERSMNRLALPPETFDSIRGGPHDVGFHGGGSVDSIIHVVYQDIQVYPDFVVAYRERRPGDTFPGKPRDAA